MDWIISDIHGCFFTLEKLIAKVRHFDESAVFICIGDYADRGLRTKEVVEYLIDNKDILPLRGNHDEVLDWIFNEHSLGDLTHSGPANLNLINVGAWWMVNGLLQTMTSYGVVPVDGMDFLTLMNKFTSNVPQSHKDFFRDLKLFWENETHFACHAYFKPNETLPRTMDFVSSDFSTVNGVLWNRFEGSWQQGVSAGVHPDVKPIWDRIGVFGHTPVGSYGAVAPIKHNQIRLIDTGAFTDGYLTAYCCQRDDWQLQATDSRDIKEGK